MNRQDKAFMTVFTAVIGMLAGVGLVILVIARIVSGTADRGYDRSEQITAATAERLKPVGQVVVAGSKEAKAEQAQSSQKTAATGDGGSMTGEQVYKKVCSACHAVGALGSPKFGDKAAWEPRYKQGLNTLLDHALHGYKKMPAKGGHPSLTKQNVHDAIVYMLSHSGIKVPQSTEGGQASASASGSAASSKQASSGGQTSQSGSGAAQNASSQQAGSGSTTSAASAGQTNAQSGATKPTGNGTATAGGSAGFNIPANIDLAKGKTTYQHVCIACHGTGVAGAPKFGDKTAWDPRIAKGWDTLAQHALHGFKGMPPKGGRPDLPDQQILDAMAYMTSHSK